MCIRNGTGKCIACQESYTTTLDAHCQCGRCSQRESGFYFFHNEDVRDERASYSFEIT
jgi:hypothetical protein